MTTRLSATSAQAVSDKLRRQLPFAFSLAGNLTLNDAQAEMRARINRIYDVKQTRFINNLVKIKKDDRFTKESLVGKVRIEGPDSVTGRETTNKAQILLRHEEGGTFTAGALPFFIPSDALRSQRPIARSLYPTSLRVAPRRTPGGDSLPPLQRITKSGKVQIIGKRRTFVLQEAGGSPSARAFGVYQREGKDRLDGQLLWFYTRRIRLRPTLQAEETLTRTYKARFPVNFRSAYARAVQTAR